MGLIAQCRIVRRACGMGDLTATLENTDCHRYLPLLWPSHEVATSNLDFTSNKGDILVLHLLLFFNHIFQLVWKLEILESLQNSESPFQNSLWYISSIHLLCNPSLLTSLVIIIIHNRFFVVCWLPFLLKFQGQNPYSSHSPLQRPQGWAQCLASAQLMFVGWMATTFSKREMPFFLRNQSGLAWPRMRLLILTTVKHWFLWWPIDRLFSNPGSGYILSLNGHKTLNSDQISGAGRLFKFWMTRKKDMENSLPSLKILLF